MKSVKNSQNYNKLQKVNGITEEKLSRIKKIQYVNGAPQKFILNSKN